MNHSQATWPATVLVAAGTGDLSGLRAMLSAVEPGTLWVLVVADEDGDAPDPASALTEAAAC